MKSLLFYTICLLSAIKCFGQVSVQHSHAINHILTDRLSNIYFVDDYNNLFKLSENEIISFDDDFKRIVFKQSLKRNNHVIIDGQLKEIKNNKIINVEGMLSYVYKSENAFINKTTEALVAKDQFKNCSYNFSGSIIDALIIGESPYVLLRDSLLNICNKTSIALPFIATSFAGLDDNLILISSEENGLWLFRNNRIKKYFIQGVNFPNKIKLIKKHDNTIWILAIDKTLFNYNIDQQLLKRVAVNVEDFVLDYWHKLWYATNQSITSNINYVNNKFPFLTIKNIKVDGENKPFNDKVILNENQEITIDYHLDYSPNSKLSVLYKLSNESEWQTSLRSPIVIENINSKTTNIELKTSSDGEYYTKPINLKLNISTSFWGSFLSYVILGLAGLIFMMLLSFLRVSQQNKILKVEQKALKLELEVTKKEQKLGQLQLNPHFIFNTMNSINGLIALDKKSIARRALSKFATIMRSVLSFSFDERIKAEEELKFLKDYIQLEQLMREDNFDFTISSEIKNLDIPPMLIQPFVENAIIHGLQHKKEKGQLDIHLEESGKYIKVVIEDNGIGRKAAQDYRKETHNSSAIKIVGDRIEKLDKWKMEEPITYIDLYENKLAVGTKCILQIPK